MISHGHSIGTLAKQFVAALAASALLGASAPAAEIDLSLNLVYADPMDAASGGMWEVVAKSDEQGIEFISFGLTGTDGAATFGVPTGTLSSGGGTAPAGFRATTDVVVDSTLSITASQSATVEGQATAFFGFGTTMNGSPMFDGADPMATQVGTDFGTNLTNVTNAPWATGDRFGDAAFDTAGLIASGTFGVGQTPEFSAGTLIGFVYTTTDTDQPIGDRASATVTTIVRDNLLPPLPDYNGNGVVDAADYTVWRDTLGMTVPMGTGADGDGDGQITGNDYVVWRDNFGAMLPAPAVVPTQATPEPGAALMTAVFGMATLAFRRQKQGVSKPQGVFCKKQEYGEKLLDTPETRSHNAAK